jgi:hypothetical protein
VGLESTDSRYERIPWEGCTFRLECECTLRRDILSCESLRLVYAPRAFVCVYVNRAQVEGGETERATERKDEGELKAVGLARPVEQVLQVE